EACEAVDRRVRNRILEPAAVKEQLLELEAVSFTFPKVAVWWNSLRHYRASRFRFVDEGRADHPRARELHGRSRPLAQARDRLQSRGDERSKRIDQNVLIVNVTSIQRVLRVDAIVDAQQVFAIVEGVRLLERDVIAHRTVSKSGRETDRGAIHVGDGQAVSSDPVCGNDVSQCDVVAAEATGPVRLRGDSTCLRIEHRSSTRVRRVVRIPQHTVVSGAYDAVWSTQAERKVAIQLTETWNGATLRGREPADVFPLLTAEEKEFVFEDWATEAVTEVVEAQRGPHGRKERARVEFVVAYELKRAAVKIVAAAASNETHLCAGIAAVFG